MSTPDTPLADAVDEFLDAHTMSPATFGRLAMRDPHFVRDLRNGRRLWPETEQRVRKFLAEYQPTSNEAAAA